MDVRVEDLFYIYESHNEPVVALRGLYLSAISGECLVVRGPNGSGKSTLVKLLTGFFTPTAGKILIGDQDVSKIDPLRLRRELVSSIDQRGNLIPDITVLENIALAYALIGQSRSLARQSARALLANHDFGELSSRYPSQLSAGERQFSSLLTAMATNPKLLIADEPSGELDNASAEIIYALLKSLAEDVIVILVTHDARAERYANRVVQIREGRISEEWLPGEPEKSVVDPLGWMRVRETLPPPPKRNVQRRGSVGPNIIHGANLGLSYGEKVIFSDLDIVGAGGQLIALSSTSGSGKSSLLRILSGIQEPTNGEVFINGQSLRWLSREARADLRRSNIGYLAQGGGALSNISLLDHVGRLRSEFENSFGTRMARPLASFSGGERARIELLKILNQGKQILFLDEPTSQMDERRSLEAVAMILDYVDSGGLVITSTRDRVLIENADQVVTSQ